MTKNEWVDFGLMNGALGAVKGFIWPQGGDPASADSRKRDQFVSSWSSMNFAAACMPTVAAALGDRNALFGTADCGCAEWSGAEVGSVW